MHLDPSHHLQDAILLRLPRVLAVTGLTRSTVYRLVARKSFPSQVQLSDRTVAWRSRDVEEWTRSRRARQGCDDATTASASPNRTTGDGSLDVRLNKQPRKNQPAQHLAHRPGGERIGQRVEECRPQTPQAPRCQQHRRGDRQHAGVVDAGGKTAKDAPHHQRPEDRVRNAQPASSLELAWGHLGTTGKQQPNHKLSSVGGAYGANTMRPGTKYPVTYGNETNAA